MSSVIEEEGGYLRLAPRVRVAEAALRFQTSRSGGPGGQNVNKVSSAVEIWCPVTALQGLDEHALTRLRNLAGSRVTKEDEIHLRAEEARSQRDNKQTVLERLAELVRRAAVRPKIRRKTKPSRASKQRRLTAKKELSEKKVRRKTLD